MTNSPRQRFEYVLRLVDHEVSPALAVPAEFTLRAVELTDRLLLAELLLAAYRGTIDDEGETLEGAVAEIDRFMSEASKDAPLLEHSVLLIAGSTIVCACLVCRWHRRQCPLVAFVVCHPAWKRRGLAAMAVAESARRLRAAGFAEVRAVITDGNVASERLFARAGFKRIVAP